jgi:F420-non-reducing hydrogenase small subunit
VCEECPYERRETRITGFHRPHTYVPPDKDQCLLEQGIVCMGPATRSGCGAMCLQARLPCRGCYGPLPGIEDQGAKVIAAIGSLVASEDEEEIKNVVDQIVDPAGTFYRFSMANSYMVRRKLDE